MAAERIKSGLVELGEFLKRRLLISLEKQGVKATGDLMQSIEMAVEVRVSSIDLVERHNFYGDFVDRGRKPGVRRIPVDVLEAWLRQRRFEFAIENTRGVAFAIQASIFEKGIKPKPWLTSVINASGPIIEREVQRAADKDMEVQIDNLVRFANRQLNLTAA